MTAKPNDSGFNLKTANLMAEENDDAPQQPEPDPAPEPQPQF